MGQGTTVGGPRKTVAKSMFRLEIDGINGDVRMTTLGVSKINFKFIETYEAGRRTIAARTVTGHTYEPFKISRAQTDGNEFGDWVQNQKNGVQDWRNGTLYWLDTEGNDLWSQKVYNLQVMDYQDLDGDAKAMEESMNEDITLAYTDRDEKKRIQ